MTYALFLLLFLDLPIVLFLLVARRDGGRGRLLPPELHAWPVAAAIGIHILVAVLYTTPWDNYLVATRVWWYNPALVTGWRIGWVPLEEYTFFVLQSVLTGLVWLALARRLPIDPRPAGDYRAARWVLTAILGVLWLAALAVFLSGWKPGTYLSITLAWALLPLLVQAAFGGDILWRHRRLVLATVGTATLYLALTDSIAIRSGTWTIDPAQSLHTLLGGILPLEELVFFLVTNCLLVFGMTLLLSRETWARLPRIKKT